MSSPSVQKLHSHSNSAFPMSIIQAYLPQWPLFLQHALAIVIQQSRYSVFYNRNTPIQLGLL